MSIRTSSAVGTLALFALVGCGLEVSSEEAEGTVAAEAFRGQHGVAGAGELLVLAATGESGSLFRVKRDGTRRLLSDFGNAWQGIRITQPSALGVQADGNILVLARAAGARGTVVVVRIDARSGQRALLSDFGNLRQGPGGAAVSSLALTRSGDILVTASAAGTNAGRFVYAVDRDSGRRTLVSDFENPRQGPTAVDVEHAAAIPGERSYLATDRDFGSEARGALFAIDPRSGRRTLVSDFGDATQGPVAVNPSAFVFEPNSRRVLVLDDNGVAGSVLRVDYVTGKRTLVSRSSDPAGGPVLPGASTLQEDADGSLLTTSLSGSPTGAGALYRIHPGSGVRTLLSDFGDPELGPVGQPIAVAGAFAGSGELRGQGFAPTPFEAFAFTSHISTSGVYADGDVRLDAVSYGGRRLEQDRLVLARSATILIDDGVDVVRGGNNFAAGQGISSALDDWEGEGPATITPSGEDLAAALGNFNLSSIIVTREAVGTASLQVTFAEATDTFLFWERGSAASSTRANSDVLVEAIDGAGRVTGAYKLLRSEYQPEGIEITTWNGSFSSPSTPTAAQPQLGSTGLKLDHRTRTLRLTSVQQEPGGLRDDGPDYKVIAASSRGRR
jgi:6-phosphogluconolactonase (cycloisomerase 2 family)